jgi:hypothetical protein
VLTKLKNLNASKAPRPNGIPNWILKTYGEILASPIFNLLNTSYQEEKLPIVWKRANITPVPKEAPVHEINKLILGQFRLLQQYLNWPRISKGRNTSPQLFYL